jgi:hypothetical protein
MAREDEKTLGDEIEITPEMVEAGIAALVAFNHDFESEEAAAIRIFRAMARARCSEGQHSE